MDGGEAVEAKDTCSFIAGSIFSCVKPPDIFTVDRLSRTAKGKAKVRASKAIKNVVLKPIITQSLKKAVRPEVR